MGLDPLANMLIRALPTSPGQANALARQFIVGQTLKGIVLRTLPEGQTLVNFAGQHVLLELVQPLARGQTFVATVEQASPALVLKVVDAPASNAANSPTPSVVSERPAPERGNVDHTAPGTLSAAQLKPYLAAKQPFGEMVAALQRLLLHNPHLRDLDPALLRRLEDTLTALLPREAEPPDADGLKAQVDRSGINYEAKVREVLTRPSTPGEQAALANDLKGQLLELLHKLEQRPTAAPASQNTDSVVPRGQGPPVSTAGSGEPAQSGETPALREQVQQALRNIEFQQLSNLFTHQENHSLLLQFTHPAFPAAHTARLYFRVDDGGGSAQQDTPPPYTLVFLLDFSALGNVRVDATVRGPHVMATICTADAAVADFITAETPTLVTRLHELGFQAEVRCQAQAEVSLEVDDSLTRLLLATPSGLVDVKA